MNDCDQATIQIEQAVFASSDRGRMKGYQLVSQSCGIDRDSSQALCRWAPTKLRSDDPDMWTINAFPVLDEWFAVTRTVLGGPEYSGRGASQVVTLILLLRDEQFASYSYNATAVVKTAMAMGYLRLPWELQHGTLHQAILPRSPIGHSSLASETTAEQPDRARLLEKVSHMITESRRVAIVGMTNPIEAVNRIVLRLPADLGKRLSFTTGLAPAIRRPFQVHFLARVDSPMQRTLDSQSIVRVNAESALTCR